MCKINLIDILTETDNQARGLMWRESIPENSGMLFVYNKPRQLSFWMKNTSIQLDIAYIGPDLRINEILPLEPYSLVSVRSRYPSIMALEVNRGALERLGVGVGDDINIDYIESVLTFERRHQSTEHRGARELGRTVSITPRPTTNTIDNATSLPNDEHCSDSDNRESEYCITGALCNGLDENSVELSGMELTDEEHEFLWEEISERDLLLWHCDSTEIQEFETDGPPGHSDMYFRYECGPKKEFIERLRSEILSIVGELKE